MKKTESKKSEVWKKIQPKKKTSGHAGVQNQDIASEAKDNPT